MTSCQTITARVVPGHQVASGQNGNPRFPGGTLRMQYPHFKSLGLDLGVYHPGTLNVSIAPCHYRIRHALHTFRQVKWHPTEPAEDFSFFDVRLVRPDGGHVNGLIYFPHPDTKPEHFQQPDVLELLLPFVDGLDYGAELALKIPTDQMVIECQSVA
ncbi:MAG: hypothetical protein ABIS50_14150 [Luteolibacter sp.]|uniref:hypothetical protein n=1 Tax=Luteolibacter sp. TaxID=1962973 RepID=UPI00326349F9